MTTTHDPLCPTDQNLPSMSPMGDWREQAKAAIEEALGHGYSSLDNFLGALVDADEPIIRADERERIARQIEAASEQEACTCHKRYAAIARGEQP